ncbi:hypothetical protein [Pseudomonas sp. PLMAX]|uniref:hypothetical protein n=1 Tax=Pseudomonas sp. PLMAX TaxID=2201998 RepID=UPI0038B9AAB6
MHKIEKLTPKSFYKENPGKLPESLALLDGREFHSVAKIRLDGNVNRTLFALFRPKHLDALFEYFNGKIKVVRQAAKAQKKDSAAKLKIKDAALRVVRKKLKTAQADLEQAEDLVQDLRAERDEAITKVQALSKKQGKPSEEAKELKAVKSELERIKGLFEQKNSENKSLNTQLKNFQAGDQKDKNDLSKALKANADLTKFISDLRAALVGSGVKLEEIAPEKSGMSTPGTVLSGSTIKITWPKPYRG